MVGELCVSALFDCGLMILAKREFNKFKYRICCGMLSTVDEFFIFVWNGTLQVFLSIKVDWSGFSLSPLQFLRSGEVISDTSKQMIVTLWLRVMRRYCFPVCYLERIKFSAFLFFATVYIFWCQIIQWLEKSSLDIHLLVPLKAGNGPKLKKCHAMYKIVVWHHGSWLWCMLA